jgi:hypothetical protein
MNNKDNNISVFVYRVHESEFTEPLIQPIDIGYRFAEKAHYLQGYKRTMWGISYGWDKVDILEKFFKSIIKKLNRKRT